MKVWLLFAVALSVAYAFPSGKSGQGTRSKAEVGGKLKTVGNAVASVSGGSNTIETLPNQKSQANARVVINAQKAAIGQANAAAKAKSDVARQRNGEQASSRGQAAARGVSVGQASTQSDANADAKTVGKGTKTDASGGVSTATAGDGAASGISEGLGTSSRQTVRGVSQSRSESLSGTKGKSRGAAGVQGASRGRGAAVNRGTTTVSGSQTKIDVIGDGKAKAVESGGATAESGGNRKIRSSRTEAGSRGTVKTKGPGAGAVGESSSKGTANEKDTTSSNSVARNQLTSTRNGKAEATIVSGAQSTLGLDKFSNDVVGAVGSRTSGSQSSGGSATTGLNGASTAANALGGGAAVADSAYDARTAGAGAVSGTIESRGQNRLKSKSAPIQLSIIERIRRQQQQEQQKKGKGPVLPPKGRTLPKGKPPTKKPPPPTLPPNVPRGKKY